mgnify:CR=1 FL=1
MINTMISLYSKNLQINEFDAAFMICELIYDYEKNTDNKNNVLNIYDDLCNNTGWSSKWNHLIDLEEKFRVITQNNIKNTELIYKFIDGHLSYPETCKELKKRIKYFNLMHCS